SFKETILRVEANDPTLVDINFERRGNTDERTIFDDTSMRLLCAALPHNTHVRRLFISGNHVTDDGAGALLGILKANLNRNVFFIDLSGNDVSQSMLDDIEMIRVHRTHGVVRVEVVVPEAARREQILLEAFDVSDHLFTALFSLFKSRAELATKCREEMSALLAVSGAEHIYVNHVLIPETFGREKIIQEEADLGCRFREAEEHLFFLTAEVVDAHYSKCESLLQCCFGAYQSVRKRLGEQPNTKLARVAVHLATNDPSITHVDVSSKPSDNDFCLVGDSATNSDTVDILSSLLEKNQFVKTIDFSYNADLSEESYLKILELCKRMQHANLSYCGLTDEYVPRLVSLINNSSLTKLNLDGNKFSNEG
ncbi:MAG: hypothetical protein FJ267_18490, partial [Planctomycetes bacterium]|nr:hypothetical protein [Planctomycetota bacterium]